ncbi:MAG: ABC transporter permease [Bryobacterales bacterium]|nr:ABC transporter permease [Bryobacterales bacterium]
MNWAARVTAWLIERYPAEFRRMHAGELREAAHHTLSTETDAASVARLVANLAAGAVVQHAAEFAADIRYARRTLGRSKLFAVCAAISFGVGIGTVLPLYISFAFTLFRPADGIANPEQLLAVQQHVAYAHFEQLRDLRGAPFAELTAYRWRQPMVLRTGTETSGAGERLWGHEIAPNYFRTLGVRFQRGQFSGEGVVISHRLWQRRFGARADAVGRRIQLNGQPVEIVAVSQPGFAGPSPMMSGADLWVPVGLEQAGSKNRQFQLAGRLRSGVTKAAAEAALDSAIRQVDPRPERDANKASRLALMPGARVFAVPDNLMPVMVGMPAAIGLLTLWIACANVGAMMLARAASRRQEVALRAALGAGRGRIVRQLLTESLLLSAAGGLIGTIFTVLTLPSEALLAEFVPGWVRPAAMQLDWGGVAVAVGSVLLCTLICGLIPAWQVSRAGVAASLKPGANVELPRFRWFGTRNQLILQQVAAALCLLLLSGYVVWALHRSADLDLGFSTRGLGTVSLDPLRDGLSPGETSELLARLPSQLASLPGVEAVAMSEMSPATLTPLRKAETFAPAAGAKAKAGVLRVGEGYFALMGIPLVRGAVPDHRDGTRAALVNQTLARQLWPEGDPIGQTIEIETARDRREAYQVSGVIQDFRNEIVQRQTAAGVYLPLTPAHFKAPRDDGWTMLVRAAPGHEATLDAARRAVESRDGRVTVFNAIQMEESVGRTMSLLRMSLATYASLGVFGLLLSAVGLAGVTAYSVALRTREIGIRVALGATPGRVLRLVLSEGLTLLTAGAVLGLAMTLGAERVLRGYLTMFGQATSQRFGEPWMVVAGCALVGLLGLAACYLPARRALRVDPMTALRE